MWGTRASDRGRGPVFLPRAMRERSTEHPATSANPGTQQYFRDSLGVIRMRSTFYSSVNPSFLPPSSHHRRVPLTREKIDSHRRRR